MLKLGNYYVEWRHNRSKKSEGINDKGIKETVYEPGGSTTCNLYGSMPEIQDGVIMSTSIATGVSVCSVEDHFNRKLGRKLALERAIQDGIPKDKRKAIWEDFYGEDFKG